MWGDMPTGYKFRFPVFVLVRFNHPKMWGDMPTYPITRTGGADDGVSIIRRCGGTCRLLRGCPQIASSTHKFQSSEDVGGHADQLRTASSVSWALLCFNHPKMWGDMPTLTTLRLPTSPRSVSIIRRCGGTCRQYQTISQIFVQSFVSIIRRCGGTCRQKTTMLSQYLPVFVFQSSEDVGGHADLKSFTTRTSQELGFNHPKMWGDMPTGTMWCLPSANCTSFNHPKMWGDMPTWFLEQNTHRFYMVSIIRRCGGTCRLVVQNCC